MNIPVWAIVAGVVSLVAAVIGFAIWIEQRRTKQIREAAVELGFEVLDSLPADMDGCRSRFALFNSGRARKVSNVLQRQVEGLQVLLYDYTFTTGSGKHSHTHHQTVAMFGSQELNLPEFRLSPEGWLSKLAQMFGTQDIDFEDSPEFSKQFVLAGTSELAIREFFDADRRTSLTVFDGLCVETCNDCVVIWFQNRRIPAAGVREFFEKTFEVYTVLKARQVSS